MNPTAPSKIASWWRKLGYAVLGHHSSCLLVRLAAPVKLPVREGNPVSHHDCIEYADSLRYYLLAHAIARQ